MTIHHLLRRAAGLALVTLCACSALQQTLHGETPRPKVAESREGCDANADRVWNIGPGRLEDIAAREPSFYEYRQYHGQFANERRVHALRKAAAKAGMVLNERPGNGHVLVEFGPPEGPPLHLAAFKSDDDQPVVIVSVDECPEIQLIDRCVDDKFEIEIKTTGKVACVGSTPGDLLLGLAGREVAIEPNRAHVIDATFSWVNGSTATLRRGEKVLFRTQIKLDRFETTTQRAVLNVQANGRDRLALAAYQALPDELKTDDFKSRVALARLNQLRGALPTLHTSEDLLNYLRTLDFTGTLPGADALIAEVKPRVRETFVEFASGSPTPTRLAMGLWLLDLLDEDVPRQDDFVALYGSLVARGTLSPDPKQQARAEEMFEERFPDTTYVADMRRRRETEAKQRQAERERSLRQQEIENDWYDLRREGNEIVSLEYRRRWLQKYGPNTPHNRRGIQNMAAGIRIKKERFCKEKRALVNLAGAASYREMASNNCSEAPPQEDLGTGLEVLDKECRAFFLSGC